MRAFRFLSTKYALEALRTEQLKVSRFDDLNDPFELYGVELKNPDHRKSFRQFKRWVSQKFGLLCFSRRWQNPLLWSHYGDRHRGVALELEIDDDLVAEVQYSPYRLRLDIERKLAAGVFYEEDAYRMAVTKSVHWKYEEGVRIFVEISKCRLHNGLFFEPLSGQFHIVGIVSGPPCDLSPQEVKGALPRGRLLHLTTSRLAFRTFSVVPIGQWQRVSYMVSADAGLERSRMQPCSLE